MDRIIVQTIINLTVFIIIDHYLFIIKGIDGISINNFKQVIIHFLHFYQQFGCVDCLVFPKWE